LGSRSQIPEHYLPVDADAAEYVLGIGLEDQILDTLLVAAKLDVSLEQAVLSSLGLWFVQVICYVFLDALKSLAGLYLGGGLAAAALVV